jgi:hypothetical protein
MAQQGAETCSYEQIKTPTIITVVFDGIYDTHVLASNTQRTMVYADVKIIRLNLGEYSIRLTRFLKGKKIRHTHRLRMHGDGEARRVHYVLRNPSIEVTVLGNAPIL